MTTALVLGGAACLHDDIRAASAFGPFSEVVACNEAGAEFYGITAWVTLHANKFPQWIKRRAGNGYNDVPPRYTHDERYTGPGVTITPWGFPGQQETGSSGMYAAKVALVDLGCDRAILCGVPMTQTPHFFDDGIWNGKQWDNAGRYFKRWQMVSDEYKSRVRSMSGATRELLGEPTADWLA